MPAQWWSVDASGGLRLHLEAEEAQTVLAAVMDFRTVLIEATDDPITERLFPRAYLDPTEEAAETTWRALTGPDLLRERFDRIAVVATGLSTLANSPRSQDWLSIEEEHETFWLTVLNDMRLALGSAIGISDDGAEIDPGDPGLDEHAASAHYMYQALTYFHGDLIELMLSRIGDAPLGDS